MSQNTKGIVAIVLVIVFAFAVVAGVVGLLASTLGPDPTPPICVSTGGPA